MSQTVEAKRVIAEVLRTSQSLDLIKIRSRIIIPDEAKVLYDRRGGCFLFSGWWTESRGYLPLADNPSSFVPAANRFPFELMQAAGDDSYLVESVIPIRLVVEDRRVFRTEWMTCLSRGRSLVRGQPFDFETVWYSLNHYKTFTNFPRRRLNY